MSMKKGYQKIPRFLRAIFFHLLQWTWCLPQNLAGLLLLPFLRGKRYRYHGALVTIFKIVRFIPEDSGFSLGSFIFMPESWSEYNRKHLVVHEYGHTVQSMMVGPFYLLAVGLPSVIWVRRFWRKRSKYRTRGIGYTDRYPEKSADRLGEYVTGEKPY
jgi:hypothetical protein